VEINLKVDLDIHEFSGYGITHYESGMTNCVIHNANGRASVTQRPAINISEDSTTIPALNGRGRGIYYWEKNSKLYIVHDNDLYEDSQSSTRITENTGTFSTGTEHCTMLETIGVPRLVILDSENNKGWVLSVALSLDQIISNFPSTITNGGTILDGYLFVMDEEGIIYNSEVDDPTTFLALSFIEAERENDKGVYLGKHHNHIVALQTRTIEFFYNNNSATGSPLQRREDVMHNIGCADGLAVWENGDVLYFLGSNNTGQVAVYKIQNFGIQMVSTDTLNSYFTQGLTEEGIRVKFSGISSMGHDVLIITVYVLTGSSPGTITPKLSFSYDATENLWGFIDTSLNSHVGMPVMAFTKRTGGQNSTVSARSGEGIFSNGDIFSVNDKLIPVDTLLGSTGVYETGVYEPGVYVASSSDVGTNINTKIRTGLIDGGVREYKFQSSEYLLAENTDSTQLLTIQHSEESTHNFDTGNTVDLFNDRKEVYQGGRFIKRNFQLSYSGNEQMFLESFNIDVEAGI